MSRTALLAASLLAAATLAAPARADYAPASDNFFKPVPNFVPPAPGEHPRLFFRKADLAKFKARAATPEGQDLIARTKFLLDGATQVRDQPKFTLWDAAAFGFLYQATGEKKYVQLATDAMEKAWAGTPDADKRYCLNPPGEPLRNGMALSSMAVAYDLLYDAWTPEQRQTQAQKIFTWSGHASKKGGQVSLEQLAMHPNNPNPVSNHFGLQVGGAGLTLLALMGDPELTPEQNASAKKWYEQGVFKAARKVLTEDFGQTGYFAEHAGPGVISMTWTMTPWLKAERIAAGHDWFADPRFPNPNFMTLRFVMETLPTDKGPYYTNPSPQGGYGTEKVEQAGGHHATIFCSGFGAIDPKYAPALLWTYNHFVQPYEAATYPSKLPDGQKSFDTFTYPHRPMYAFVNWPFDTKEQNPETLLPKFVADEHYGRFVFRNRWQDKDDIVVALLLGARTADRGTKRLMVWGLQQKITFGNLAPSITGNPKIGQVKLDAYQGFADGSGCVAAGGNLIAVDFSRASGADAVIVIAGPGAGDAKGADPKKSKVQTLELAGRKVSLLTLSSTGTHPTATASGNTLTLGAQTLTLDGQTLTFAKTAKKLP